MDEFDAEFAAFQQELESSILKEAQATSTSSSEQKSDSSQKSKSRTSTSLEQTESDFSVVPEKKRKRYYRAIAGEAWVDETLADWPENDFRIFVGNLSNDVNDTMLTNAFQKYSSFHKAKVARSGGQSRGFGFVSLLNVDDYLKAMKEMQGQYLGLKPIQLKRSDWKSRNTTKKTVSSIKEPRRGRRHTS
ncbi:hypothetical protein RCL1_003923 [Eukaryota sp. TZLM3-RCL]